MVGFALVRVDGRVVFGSFWRLEVAGLIWWRGDVVNNDRGRSRSGE